MGGCLDLKFIDYLVPYRVVPNWSHEPKTQKAQCITLRVLVLVINFKMLFYIGYLGAIFQIRACMGLSRNESYL